MFLVEQGMATFKTFEDIEAWQISRQLSSAIFNIANSTALSKDYGLKDQINRSSGSVMDNIAEGFDRGGSFEFIQFLGYAKGSCGEVKSQLCRCLDRKYISKEEFDNLIEMANNVGKMIRSLMEYLNRTSIRGEKFKDRNLQKQ